MQSGKSAHATASGDPDASGEECDGRGAAERGIENQKLHLQRRPQMEHRQVQDPKKGQSAPSGVQEALDVALRAEDLAVGLTVVLAAVLAAD